MIYTLHVIVRKFLNAFFQERFLKIYFKDFKDKLFKEEFIVRNICPFTSPWKFRVSGF